MLGPATSSYLGTGDHVARTIAANGLRLVLDEHRTTETPTLKSGKPGKTKVTYGEPDAALAWLWKFVDGAKTAGELYGRTLVVFAAQHYASQLVLATSQRRVMLPPLGLFRDRSVGGMGPPALVLTTGCRDVRR